MKRVLTLIGAFLVGALLLLLLPQPAQSQTAPQAKITAKILYACNYNGNVSSARAKEFVDLLKTYFTDVGTVDVTKLQARDADAYDVLLVDAEAKGDGASALDVPNLTLPDNFSKPTVTIGVMGGLFTSRRGLLTGYL
jgi:hypothetical protein